MRRCPLCGDAMTSEVGRIEFPAIDRFMRIVRRVKLGRFWSCWTCEHCEEH